MKHRTPKTRWNLIIILIIFGAISYAGYKYFMPKPQQADIFAITPDSLNYGETTVIGELRKTAPAGEVGEYLLALPDSRVIVLDISGVDHLVGQTVILKGELFPSAGPGQHLSMKVAKLTL
jgi:hypothetical protein